VAGKMDWDGHNRRVKAGKLPSLSSKQWIKRHTPPPSDNDICIVVGAHAPSSKTGERQTYRFRTVAEAHRGGFPWAV
jgi:hypothetical protein